MGLREAPRHLSTGWAQVQGSPHLLWCRPNQCISRVLVGPYFIINSFNLSINLHPLFNSMQTGRITRQGTPVMTTSAVFTQHTSGRTSLILQSSRLQRAASFDGHVLTAQGMQALLHAVDVSTHSSMVLIK